jgi:two-component system, OmpR family, sensor histidine kinase KdpD
LIKVDAPLMEQAVENLLLNAAIHTPPGTLLQINVGIDQTHPRVFLTVADWGPGIPAEMRGCLFGKFRRGKSTTAGGVGLGLSIVRGFVEAQGGEVLAEDNPGGGAKFTIFLPLVLPELAPEE